MELRVECTTASSQVNSHQCQLKTFAFADNDKRQRRRRRQAASTPKWIHSSRSGVGKSGMHMVNEWPQDAHHAHSTLAKDIRWERTRSRHTVSLTSTYLWFSLSDSRAQAARLAFVFVVTVSHSVKRFAFYFFTFESLFSRERTNEDTTLLEFFVNIFFLNFSLVSRLEYISTTVIHLHSKRKRKIRQHDDWWRKVIMDLTILILLRKKGKHFIKSLWIH